MFSSNSATRELRRHASVRPSIARSAIALILAAILFAPAPAFAAPGDAWIVAPTEVVAGGQLVIEVHLDVGASEMAATQLSVFFDPTLLQLDQTYGILGVGGGGIGSAALFAPMAVNPNDPGEVTWNIFTLDPGYSGLLWVSTVAFDVIGTEGALASLTMDLDQLVTMLGDPIPAGSTFPRPATPVDILIDPEVPVPTFACGDVDASGAVNILDSLMVAHSAVGLIVLDGEATLRADVEGDLDVDILDALGIAYDALGIPITLSCP